MAAGGQGRTWYIRHVDLFSGLSEHDTGELARALTPRHVAAGQLIVGPEPADACVYVTRSGTVRLFQHSAEGRQVTIERLDRGQLFGVTRLVGAPSTARLLAEAETDVELCVVEEHRFLEIVARWPKAIVDLAARLGVRFSPTEEDAPHVNVTGARARLARALLELAREVNEQHPSGGLRLRAVPRHSDLAEQIDASRETVTRMLARLEDDGYIRRFGRQIVIPDPARLAEDFGIDAQG
jgi:CRP/FNR family transcriptional regulator, cyclic AMP receptor protein